MIQFSPVDPHSSKVHLPDLFGLRNSCHGHHFRPCHPLKQICRPVKHTHNIYIYISIYQLLINKTSHFIDQDPIGFQPPASRTQPLFYGSRTSLNGSSRKPVVDDRGRRCLRQSRSPTPYAEFLSVWIPESMRCGDGLEGWWCPASHLADWGFFTMRGKRDEAYIYINYRGRSIVKLLTPVPSTLQVMYHFRVGFQWIDCG